MDLAVDDQAGVVEKDSVTWEGRGQRAGSREKKAGGGQRSAVSSQQSAVSSQQEKRVGARLRVTVNRVTPLVRFQAWQIWGRESRSYGSGQGTIPVSMEPSGPSSSHRYAGGAWSMMNSSLRGVNCMQVDGLPSSRTPCFSPVYAWWM